MSDRARTPPATERHNRWLILGVAATVALGMLVTASLTGVLDRGHHSRRDAVAVYIREVNAAQQSVASQRRRVGAVYAKARTDPNGLAASLPALRRSVVTLRLFDARLRALRPPPAATGLHRRLIVLSSAEAHFARQIVLLGAYLPLLGAERRVVGKAGETLRLDLRSSKGAQAQAAAFDRFAGSLTAAARPLATATPPSSLEPTRTHELAQTSDLAATARGLAAAIRARRAADAQRLLYRLSAVAAGNGNAAERKAVIAFDAQARRVNELRLSVANERQRLDRELR